MSTGEGGASEKLVAIGELGERACKEAAELLRQCRDKRVGKALHRGHWALNLLFREAAHFGTVRPVRLHLDKARNLIGHAVRHCDDERLSVGLGAIEAHLRELDTMLSEVERSSGVTPPAAVIPSVSGIDPADPRLERLASLHRELGAVPEDELTARATEIADAVMQNAPVLIALSATDRDGAAEAADRILETTGAFFHAAMHGVSDDDPQRAVLRQVLAVLHECAGPDPRPFGTAGTLQEVRAAFLGLSQRLQSMGVSGNERSPSWLRRSALREMTLAMTLQFVQTGTISDEYAAQVKGMAEDLAPVYSDRNPQVRAGREALALWDAAQRAKEAEDRNSKGPLDCSVGVARRRGMSRARAWLASVGCQEVR